MARLHMVLCGSVGSGKVRREGRVMTAGLKIGESVPS